METLREVFMRRDGMTKEGAEDLIDLMRAQVREGCDPEALLYDEGLEPDYVMELL